MLGMKMTGVSLLGMGLQSEEFTLTEVSMSGPGVDQRNKIPYINPRSFLKHQ